MSWPGDYATITGRAVVGNGQCLAWTPCCNAAVRLAQRWTEQAKVVPCPQNAERYWRLEFVRVAAGQWAARWTPIPSHADGRSM